jgi:molecular chaperone HscB
MVSIPSLIRFKVKRLTVNYFEFYNIEEKFFIDELELKQRFFAISKENHPDFFIDDDARYQDALDVTSTNNTAYKTLNKLELRVKYVLEINEVLKEAQNAIPQEFLMEMMDVNEAIMELQMSPDEAKRTSMIQEVAQLEEGLNTTLETDAKKADQLKLGSAERGEELEKIKETYLKLKYVLRIKESLNTFAP